MAKDKDLDYLLFSDVDRKQFDDVKRMLKEFKIEKPMWQLQNRNGEYIPVRLNRGKGALLPLYMSRYER
jgi:hypothetical protein